ncbi:T9SS type A sorting domain-containing protein [Phaeodactylibacter xiamenensis]|uniref:T9SS type A sorting domain-containing protein n=3 Tax=Phaeodactylibacter xiamenensis TaxID=1524460 RepID=UPI00126A1843|nr:T9SS type A sorting domain-containing protein [Phaeodactylibacter xiamenensis]
MRYFLLLLLSIPLWARAQAPQWSAPNGSAFSYSANLTAVLELDGQVSLSANDQLAAFVGDEIRGKAMAVDLNGKVLHFMTIFSNVPTGEEIELRAYIAADDEVYTSVSSFVFDQSSVTGSASTPYSVQLSSDGDLLISLDSLPTQARLQGLSFFPVPLRDYLNQADTDPVSWSVSNSLYFQHSIAGDTLFLSVADPDWTGTDTLTITATEQTVNAYSASQNLVLTVEPGLNGPAFDSIPVQSVMTGQPFPSLMLGDYESSYTGNCLSYSYKPVPAIGMPEQQASWVIGGGGWPFTMSVLATTTYSPSFLFQSDEDKLGAFIGGELRGAASAQIINGQRLFTMQVYHTAIDGEIEFRYFSDSLKRVFVLPDTFDFVSGGQLGTPSQPQILDFSPLSYTLDSQTGALSVGLRVPGWEGVEEVQFRASDCSYPAELQDTVTVLFCSGPDTDGDGLCDQLDPDPDDACNPDALNGNCDADGDGVYADVDPDDGDPCNPLIEVEVLSAAGPSCPEATDGHVEIGLTTPYCSGGRFDIYLEEASLPVQQLGSGQLLPDTFRVESLGAGTYSLRIELSEAGSCTYSSSCFPFITDSLAQLVSQDSLSPALFVDAGSGALPASDTLQYFAGPEACGLSLSWQAEVSDNCTAPPLQYSVSCEGCSEMPEAAIAGSTLSLFAGVGANQLELWATDADSNSIRHTYVLMVQDTVPPHMLCTGHTIYLDEEGIGSIAVGDIDGGSNDACGLDTLFLSQTVFGCSDVGPNTVTLTAVDKNDNEAFCTATVTVLDSIAPQLLCTDHTVYLDGDGIGSIALGDIDGGSNDACGLDTLFLSRTVFGCSDVGELPVTLTGVDENGNSGTCTATIAVRDTVGPVMLCQSRTVTLSVFGTGSLSAAHVNAGSNDACGAVSLSLSQSSFDCGDVGVQSVTLTGTDVNGNSSSCEALVTVEDLSPPSVLCSSPEVQVSYDGTYELLLSDVYAGGFDACGIDTILYDAAIYTCEDIGGTYEVQVTSIDVNGNESSCTSTVSVQQSPGLPPEWSVTGLNGSPGSATWDICTDSGTLNLWSGGYHSGSGGSPDGYLFVHQPFCASKGGLQLDLGAVSGDSYIGLSVRSSLLPDAAMAGLYWNGSGLLRWEVREADGALREVTLLDAPNAKKIRLEYSNGTWRGRYQILGAGWLNLAAVSMPQPLGSCFEVGVGGFTVDPSGSMSGSVSKVRVVVLEQQVWSPPVTSHTSGPGNGLIIWPNPTAGAAVLEWAVPLEAGAEVRIYGPLGQLALPVQQAVAGQQQLKLDMEGLPAGVYTVQCRSAGAQGRQTLKLVRY